MENDETFGCLPPLSCWNQSDEEFDNESSWFNLFMGDTSEDYDCVKLHELVVEYLVYSGYKEAAELLVKDADLPSPTPPTVEGTKNADTLEQRNAIRDAIISGDLESGLKLINELAPTLLDTNKKLHFKLLRQQLVELIRNKQIEQVLNFAQEHLVDRCADIAPELFTKLEQTYALVAFENPESSPFGHLMNLNQRNMLAYEVNESILATLHKPSVSRLEQLFRLMVWNQHQIKSKGDGRHLSRDAAEDISKNLYARDDDPMNELL